MKNYFKILTTILALMAVFLMPEMGWGQSTTTYTFSSKAWAASPANWTSGKDGNQFTSGRGVQVTTGASGANATSPISFTNVSQVVVTYSTNASNGAGSVSIQIGSNTAVSQNVTTTGGTTDRTLTYNYSPSQTGNVKLSVTCTTNSIYVKSVVITTSSGDTPTSHTVTFNPGNGTCATTSLTGSTINLPTATPSATCATAGWAFAGWATASVGETTTAPTLLTGSYLPTSDLTLYAVYSITEGDGGTSTFNFADIASANGWENGVAYTSVTIPPITITAAGGGNNGKWYTSGGGSWRMYSGGTVNISGSGIAVTAVTSSPSCSFAISSGSASFSPTARTDFTNITVTYGSSTTSYATSPTCTALTATTTTIDDSGITNTDVYTSTSAGSLSATVKENVNNTTISGATVTWSSSNTGVATIASDGAVTLVAAGTTIITASYAGQLGQYQASSATYKLTVTNNIPSLVFRKIDGHTPIAGKTYLIVDLNSSRALTSANGSSSAPAAVSVTITNNEITTNNTALQWTFEASSDHYIIHPVDDDTKWLFTTNTNNGVRVGTDSDKTWDLGKTSGNYKGFQHVATSRYLGVYNNSDWRTYTTIHENIANTNIALFVHEDCTAPADPTISASGSDCSARTVTLTCSGADAIYYTLDGTTPTSLSDSYTAPFSISSTTTVKAVAYSGVCASGVAEETYYVAPAAPVFSLAEGIYNGTQSVTITATGADHIYYTTDGTTTPTDASTEYTGAISVSSTTTIKAIAYSGSCTSGMSTVTYTICASPAATTFSPAPGIYSEAQTVTISAESGTTIYYTTDGSDPTTSATSSTYSTPITVSATTTIKAVALSSCGTDNYSTVASAKYRITDGCGTRNYELVTAVPVAPEDWTGEYAIAYVDGTTAHVFSGEENNDRVGYVDASVDDNTIDKDDADDYRVYFIKDDTSYLLWINGYYVGCESSSITLSETGTGAAYHWNINYTNGHATITNASSTTLLIIWNNATSWFDCYVSPTADNQTTRHIQLFKKDAIPSPYFSLREGTYVDERTVDISTPVPGASVYYTTDGTTPTDASELYTSTLTISETCTLKAVVKSGECYSDVTEAYYRIVAPECLGGKFKKVTEEPADWSGEYLIVYGDGNLAFDGSLGSLDVQYNTFSISVTADGIIESADLTDEQIKAKSFTIAAVTGGYSIKSASGMYIGRTSGSNGMNTSTDTPYAHTISIDGSDNVEITSVSAPSASLQYGAQASASRFRYYTSAQQSIQLYKLQEAEEKEVTAVAETPGVSQVQINSETPGTNVNHTEPICNDVTFHATVSAGAYFMGWFDEDMNLVSSDLNFTFTVMEEVTYTARASLTPLLWTTAVNERPATFPTDQVIEAGGSDYVIPLTCEEDLAWFISYVNGFNGQDEHNYAKAKLCADVDMSQYVWVPIGYKTTKEFKGYFDGQCYSIDGLHIASAEEHEYVEAAHGNLMRLGMFGYTDGIDVVSEEQNAVIKNTFVTSGKFYCKSGIATATTYIGSVVGSANETTLEFCEGAAEIEANNGVSVGSVAGSVIHDSYIKACMGMSTIRTSATNTGGITGALSDVSLGDNNKSYLEHGFANSNITALSTASYKWGALVGQFYGGGYADPVYVHPDASGPTNMMGDRPVTIIGSQLVIDQTARSYAPYNKTGMLYQLVTKTGDDIQISPRATYTQVTPVTYTSRTTGNEVTIESTTQALCDELNSRTFHDGTTLQSLGLHWGRVYGITAINGDYPIIYPQNKVNGRVMAVAQRTGEKALRYGSVDDLIKQCNKNADGGTIYMYQTDTIRVSTNANVVVYVHDTVALMQEAATVNAVVGIVMDNSEGNGAEDRDWHFFSPSISGGKTGIIYGPQTCAYPTNTQNDLTYGEGNSYYVKDNDANVYFPNGIGAATNPDKQFDLYSYYEPEYHWINLKRIHANHWHQDEINGQHPQITYNETDNDANGEFKPGKGYMMAIGNDDDYDNTLLQAKGVLNNDVVSATVTSRGAHLKGYNLIGNPYQSYLDFNAFANLAGNASALWTGGGQGYKAYLVYDAAIDGFRQYLADESGESYSLGAENVAGRYINMHQGFFVVKNTTTESATVKFNNSMRVTDQYFNFRSEQPTYPLVNLFCSDENGKRETVIMEFERPLNAGALKMRGILNGKGQVYIHWNNDDLGSVFIDHMPDYVPVWFEAAEDGVFTMTWNTANANFGYMHLIDNIAGADIDMLENDSYTFESHVTDMKARFRLVFKPLGIEEETTEQGDNFAFINGEELVVNGTGELSFIDLNGRVLATQYMAGEQNFMALPNVAEGMYLLRLAGTNGVKVQKIIIRK